MPGPAVKWPAWRTPAAASRRPPVTSTTHRLHAWIVSWSHRGGIVPVEELAGNLDVNAVYGFIRRLFTGYTRTLPAYRRRLLERFTLTRVARKVVGVGSVGTEAWILLMEPDDGIEPLLLQAKQSQRSVLADYAGQSEYDNQGERVVAGQQLMQAVSDIFLGWQSATPPGRRSADPVRKISIIPRGQALGVTYQAPEADRYGYSETYLRGRITGTLGGRAAEEVIYGDVTTGAETIWNTPAQSPARWWAGGASPRSSGRSRCSPRPARNRPRARTAWPRPPRSSSTPKPGRSSGHATSRPWRPCAAAGTGWTGWHTPSWTGKPWTKTRRTPRPASPATPRPPRAPAPRHG